MIHPDFLFAKLTREQFQEWIAFDAISPIGERRRDIRSAIQTCHFVSALSEKDTELDPHSFLPQFQIHNLDDWEPDPFDDLQREAREMERFR